MADNLTKAAQLISSAILGIDCKVVLVADKRYVISPPTIIKLAGAARYLSPIPECKTLAEVITSQDNLTNAAKALSWLIDGSGKLTDDLAKGTMGEIMNGLKEAYSLISVQDFTELLTLAKNVSRLIANPRP